jgi:ATP-binding cassette subfamily B (MDR/TAP) protein 1
VDGRDLKDYNLLWYRKLIGYVGQEPVLFAMSIKANLLLAKPEASDAEIKGALTKANAWDFIDRLPEKLETYVGTSGSQISGGQKQRIAIARAYLLNPPILLLDESTSALDRKNEKLIQDALDEFSLNRTVITIAHRLTTIQNSDCIFVLDKGTLGEFGSHDDLMSKQGQYFDYVKKQQVDQNAQDETDEPIHEDEIEIPLSESQASPLRKQGSSNNIQQESFGRKSSLVSDSFVVESTNPAEKEKEEESKAPYGKMWADMKGNQLHFLIAGFAAVGLGSLNPIIGYMLSETISTLSNVRDGKSGASDDLTMVFIWFIIFGVMGFVFGYLSMWFFALSGQSLAEKLRVRVFRKIMDNNIPFFDKPEHSPGNLCNRLEEDCSNLQNAMTGIVGSFIMNFGCLGVAMVLAFFASWTYTLCVLAVIPLQMMAGYVESKTAMHIYQDETENSVEGNIVQENITNIKTVRAINTLENTLGIFKNALDANMPTPGSILCSAISFGVGQSMTFFVLGYAFYIGAYLRENHGLAAVDLFKVLFCLIWGAFGMAMNAALAGDVGKSNEAAARIYRFVEWKDEVYKARDPLPLKNFSGRIEFKNVSFRYPSRANYVFKDMSFVIEAGKKVAFVGQSGRGKSTVIALVLRFYDIQKGEILLDGVSIKDIDIHYLRSLFGLVSQEPFLFNNSIKYNITYNSYNVPEQKVQEAAVISNAIHFIERDEAFEGQNCLDENVTEKVEDETGFLRNVGVKGSKLSGGQKQRLAIARAVLREPSVYLYDEATSALDSNSEKVVQDALDKLAEGKTCISIAHRVSTIANSDKIFVIGANRGVVEEGTFAELMNLKGEFWKINKEA